MGERWGRKKVLVAGWLFALPLPPLIFFAPSWRWVVLANVFLGIDQGLCWSTTVIMKIDLVGPERRGLAMGLNEASGYLALSAAAVASGYIAGSFGLRETLFGMGESLAVGGLFLSLMFVRETLHHVHREARQVKAEEKQRKFTEILLLTSWKGRALFCVSQAGMVNNLNDGMAWGLFPLYFAAQGLSLERISFLAALYPAGIGSGATDYRRTIGSAGTEADDRFGDGGASTWHIRDHRRVRDCAVGDFSGSPGVRYGTAVGVYRLWRDGGYAIGALLAGSLADLFGVRWAIGAVGALTFLSGLVAATVMYETRRIGASQG